MYKHNQKTQSDVCLVCLSPILKNISLVNLVSEYPLCIDCLQKFELIDKTISFHHYPMHILYRYNEFFRTLLYQYKGLYDHALKDAFLCLFHDYLVSHYSKYTIIVAPSSNEDNEQRGFAPMEHIALTFSSQVFTGLFKKEKYKQSDLSYAERQKVHSKIGICNGHMLKGKKVLIIDDVITSGSTLSTCLSLVLAQEPKCVELLVLSTRKNIEELKFDERIG